MNPILLALYRAGKIAGPLASKAVKYADKAFEPASWIAGSVLASKMIPKIKNAGRAVDKVITTPIAVNKYIHPYGTVGAASAANAYLYGGLAHDAATGSFGPIEKKKLASIWNELDYNRGRLEGDELVRHISRTNDYPK